MTKPTQERIEVANRLEKHNAWRRGDESYEMVNPNQLGEDIDYAIKALKAYKPEPLAGDRETRYALEALVRLEQTAIYTGCMGEDWVVEGDAETIRAALTTPASLNEQVDHSEVVNGLMQNIESQKQTHDALIKKVRNRNAAIKDLVQVIDNLRNFIGRNYIAKAMPKEQEQAYDVLQKHAATIKNVEDE